VTQAPRPATTQGVASCRARKGASMSEPQTGYLPVLARGPDVVVCCATLGRADRDIFARVFFQACADADDWYEEHGEATVPPA